MSTEQSEFIIKFPQDDYKPNENGLGYEFFHCMKSNQNKVAQYIVETGETDTYGSLLQKCVRTAIKLRNKKFDYGDVVAVCSHNHKDIVVPIIASQFVGLKFSPLDCSLSLNEIVHLLNIVKPKIIFVIPERVELLEKALGEIELKTDLVVFGRSEKYEEFSTFLTPEEDENNFEPSRARSVRDTTLVYFSSGSTGAPKGICLHHYGIMAQAVNTVKADKIGVKLNLSNYTYPIEQEAVVWVTSSYYWISAPFYLVACIFAGVPRLVSREFNPDIFWSIVEKYQVTHMFWSSAIMLKLSDMCEGLAPQEVCLKSVLTAGSKLPDKVYGNLRKTYPTMYVRSGYGLTETNGPVCFQEFDPSNFDVDPSNYGKFRGDFQIKVVDPISGKIQPPTEPGELRLKSPYLMNAYHNTNSENVLDEEGFFSTGDIVRFDEDNNLYYVERLKELIKYRGYHVSPILIENVLETIPEVERAAVLGVFNQVDDEHPRAYVQLKKNFKISTDVIKSFVDAKVGDSHKLRGGVQIVDSLPLTPSDKINRAVLRKLYTKNF